MAHTAIIIALSLASVFGFVQVTETNEPIQIDSQKVFEVNASGA
jgi:hypothetical protein